MTLAAATRRPCPIGGARGRGALGLWLAFGWWLAFAPALASCGSTPGDPAESAPGAAPTPTTPTPADEADPPGSDEKPPPTNADAASEPTTATPQPWSSERLSAELERAGETLHDLGAYRKPRPVPRGPGLDTPLAADLARAYAQGRATNWRGSLKEIQQWTALAKYGVKAPGAEARRGPLAGWQLAVIVENPSRAYLHAWLEPTGPREAPEIGEHRRLDGERVWIALGDVLSPGVDYLPFKRDGSESLHHQWGRKDVIDDLADLARAYSDRTGLPLGVGDISHVTGGKLKGHWTHQLGVDADVYPLAFPEKRGDALGEPVNYVLSRRRGDDRWTTRPQGRGAKETPDSDGGSPTARRLAILAELALPNDAIAYFVHDATSVLAPFDARAQSRRAGRRYLHRRNQGYWPHHPDHVHLRWVDLDIELPGGTPRP